MTASNLQNIQSVLIVYNNEKPHTSEAVAQTISVLDTQNIPYQKIKNWVRGDCSESFKQSLLVGIQQSGIVMVFGGDGTILGVARIMAEHPIPIFGVNMGTFGFLTASQFPTLANDLEQLFKGNVVITERFLLEAWVQRNGEKVFHSYALNESLVTLSRPGRLLNVRLIEEGKPSLAYRCDGVIVATPTGSSGHSLSAGGPILEPHIPALIITPVSPHSLFNRPLVVDGKRELCIQFQHDQNGKELILDGQIHFPLEDEDSVYVKRSIHTIPTISLPHTSFTDVLQHKFHLGNVR
jgi:NAD+ kinase